MTNYKTAAATLKKGLGDASTADDWHKYGEGYGDLRRTVQQVAAALDKCFDNPGTVVVPMVNVNGGLLLIRRALADGFGKLALPGGYQGLGETWQEAGAREVLEETGVEIRAEDLAITQVVTVQDGKVNLLFCAHLFKVVTDVEKIKPQPGEVSQILLATKAPDPAEIAFPTHAEQIDRYFNAFKNVLMPADNQD
ncbi:NUDIX domain-containing protein [Ensifer sp. ENS10]|uniref:NUDIX domain-containing protein n=1 Tax=Ensifer sp. ENS10 TaxID=2769286 RepID=UPI00177EE3FD|nr:NUDIX domain-containing protein [Ensifer sp. ENS10]MBD9511564.1 NUDIX domain-containing protein [Ensifer sp. ENS10]